MPNTTNYNWATPADTDLVKDGAAAIRTLGSSADTTVKNLNPGTTAGDIDYYTSSTAKARVAIGTAGQVLRVNSGGTAPEWATTADQTPLTTKGDLFTFDTADARLGVGANGTVLTADSAEATGLKWAAASAGPTNWTLLNAGGTALTGATTITVSSLAAKEMLILVDGASAGSGDTLTLRFNSDSAANYTNFGMIGNTQSTYFVNMLRGVSNYSVSTSVSLGALANNTGSSVDAAVFIDLTDKTGNHIYDVKSGSNDGGSSDGYAYNTKGLYEGAAAITSVSIISNGSNFDAGTIYVWGAN